VEKTFDHALDPNLYLADVAKQHGINMRGSGQKISIMFDDALPDGMAGSTREIEGGHIIRIGKAGMIDEFTIGNTIAHELSHARDFLRGANRTNGLHEEHGHFDSPAGDRSVYGSGNALEEWMRGKR